MSSFQVTPMAERDLDEIFEFVDRKNPKAADKLWHKIRDQFRILSEYPDIGRPFDDLRPGMRGFTVERYVIFYRKITKSGGIEIIRVLHGARDFPSIFKK